MVAIGTALFSAGGFYANTRRTSKDLAGLRGVITRHAERENTRFRGVLSVLLVHKDTEAHDAARDLLEREL